MDPLSLLCRLAESVPPPRFHTVKYAGVLAPASRWRSRVVPPAASPAGDEPSGKDDPRPPPNAERYRPWAQLLARTFAVDVLECPECHGRMWLLAMVTDPASIARELAAQGEPAEVPARSPNRGPPYWMRAPPAIRGRRGWPREQPLLRRRRGVEATRARALAADGTGLRPATSWHSDVAR